ncbi:unnamed protein product [Amaranthus hypochondriacus]
MNVRERSSKDDWIYVGRRRDNTLQNSNGNHYSYGQRLFNGQLSRSASGGWSGHRGEPRHSWWRGPREPHSHELNVVSLFVDGVTQKTTLIDLRGLFEKKVKVLDVYISGKRRKNTENFFAFIRVKDEGDATKAISAVNGVYVHGSKLMVTRAKYRKGGKPNSLEATTAQKKLMEHRKERRPVTAFRQRDQRSYAQVLNQVSIKVSKSQSMLHRLNLSVVVEVERFEFLIDMVDNISESCIPFELISYLSPTKILLHFSNEEVIMSVLASDSPLRKISPKVRRWSDGESVNERLTWIECVGLNPICWCEETFRAIGDKWGKTIFVDKEYEGLHSITSARILIRTSVMRRIEEKIMVHWDDGMCELWINEIYREDCNSKGCNVNDELSSSEDDLNDDMPNGQPENAPNNEMVEHCEDADKNGTGALIPTSDKLDVVSSQEHVDNGPIENTVAGPLNNLDDQADISIIDRNMGDGIRESGAMDTSTSKDLHNEQTNGPCEVSNTGHGGKSDFPKDFDANMTQTLGMEKHDSLTDAIAINEEENYLDNTVDPICDERQVIMETQINVECFDPISMIEACTAPAGLEAICNRQISGYDSVMFQDHSNNEQHLIIGSSSKAKHRGRSKKRICSLPEPLWVPSTPQTSLNEANVTWNTAKKVGVKNKKEGAVLTALRKSKRLQLLEKEFQSAGR